MLLNTAPFLHESQELYLHIQLNSAWLRKDAILLVVITYITSQKEFKRFTNWLIISMFSLYFESLKSFLHFIFSNHDSKDKNTENNVKHSKLKSRIFDNPLKNKLSICLDSSIRTIWMIHCIYNYHILLAWA